MSALSYSVFHYIWNTSRSFKVSCS